MTRRISSKQIQRIALISHSASLTGAPLVATSLARYLSNVDLTHIDFLFLNSLSFCDEKSIVHHRFPRNIRILYGRQKHMFHLYHRLRSLICSQFDLPPETLPYLPPFCTYNIIYTNTLLSLEMGITLKKSTGSKLVLHLHEMSSWIRRVVYGNKALFKDLSIVDLIIAPSQRCINALNSVIPISTKTDIQIIPSPFDIHKSPLPPVDVDGYTNYLPSDYLPPKLLLAIQSDCHICICNGTDSWRKGLDYFLQIASILTAQGTNKYYFVWVSLPFSADERIQVEIEAFNLGISDYIFFLPLVPDFRMLLSLSSCYLLTSREDPMPIAAMEAMNQSIPIVCFAGTGRIPDILEHSPSQVVPYGDIHEFAKSVQRLTSDMALRDKVILLQKDALLDYSSDVVFSQISRSIQDLV